MLYVDDTNRTYTTPLINATPTPKELISHTQRSTGAWGGVAIATGASLKPEKCFAYFLVYKLSRGHAVIEGLRSLSQPFATLPAHIMVPLLDPRWVICTHSNSPHNNCIYDAWHLVQPVIVRGEGQNTSRRCAQRATIGLTGYTQGPFLISMHG